MRKNALPLSLVLLAVLAGGYLRVAHLGRDDFGPDELFHVYAAESLRQGEGPRLPSGDLYTRGIEFTRLVQLSVEALGPGERNARLPGALLGIIDLCLFAVILWALGGGWTAFWGTLLLALYPEAVAQSRAVRFYTYQLAFGLIALYAGWRALARCGARASPTRKEIGSQWLWVAVTLLAFTLAARAQIVTLSVVAGWGVCVALAAVADLRARGAAAWRTSAPLQLTAAAAAAVVLLLVAEPEAIAGAVRLSQHVPGWIQAEGGPGSPATYARDLFWSFPLLVALAPLIFLSIGFSRPRLTVYLLTWFAVPFLAHSFLFPWKGQRFILLAVPALLAAAALAAAGGAGALRRWISDRLAGYGIEAGARQLYAASSVAVISLFVIATTPALVHGWKGAASQQDNKWRKMAAIIQSRPELRTLPLGTTAPLHTLYYLGRSDFVIQPGARQRRQNRQSEGKPDVVDFKAGAPILPTPNSIRSRFGTESILISTDSGHVDSRLDPALLSMLREQAEDLCRGSCGSGLLYLWHPTGVLSGTALPTGANETESGTPGDAFHAKQSRRPSEKAGGSSVSRNLRP